MSRHTFLGFLMTALLVGSALAVDLPSEGQVVLVSADGVVAGTGTLEGGDLELELLAGFAGFGTMTVIGEAGDVFVYEVMVRTGGEVVLTDTLDDLATLVRGAGGTVDVSLRQGGTASGGEATRSAGVDEVGAGEGAKAAEPAVEVPEHADDVEETVDDHVERAADEIGDAGTIDRPGEGPVAGDAIGGLAGESDDGGEEAGSEAGTEPSEPPDEADRQGEDDRRGVDAVPTPEAPRLP